ncbi:MAG: GNAT family N-acetyltransferase [Anaerolineae bacterium]
MPTLHTARLTIRAFTTDDLDAVHTVLNSAFGPIPLARRREWLHWTIHALALHARLGQPPYGERAIVLGGTIIGAVGIVPSYGPFERLPAWQGRLAGPSAAGSTAEVGLFWALDAAHRGQGYATEAARAVIDYLFTAWDLKRVVATTAYDNSASIAVMERLGMSVAHNPDLTPEWFQVIGLLERSTHGHQIT